MNYMNLWGEQDKRKIQKKYGLVLGLTLSFESILQKCHKCLGFQKKKWKESPNSILLLFNKINV